MAIKEEIGRICWICSQQHNPDRHEVLARIYGHESKCRHREPEVELAIERARAIARQQEAA